MELVGWSYCLAFFFKMVFYFLLWGWKRATFFPKVVLVLDAPFGSVIPNYPLLVMKIAIVLNTSWNIYNFRMGVIRALLREGIEVYTIAPVDHHTPDLVEADCKHLNSKS